MVTKLKSYSKHNLCKLVAYILMLASCWLAVSLFSTSLLAAEQAIMDWQIAQWQLLDHLQSVIIYLLAAAVFIIYLAFVTGRRPADDQLQPGYLDRIYSDVLLALWMLIAGIGAWLWMSILRFFVIFSLDTAATVGNFYADSDLVGWFVSLTGCLILLLLVIVANALLRKIKARNLLRHSLIYQAALLLLHLGKLAWRWGSKLLKAGLELGINLLKRLFSWLYKLWLLVFAGSAYTQPPLLSRLFKRQRRFLVASGILVALIFFFLTHEVLSTSVLLFFGLLVLIYYFLRGNQSDFTEIKAGLDDSLAEKLKSEQLKIDLITNVSHDLKTPLTSIISYAELLSKEESLSPAAVDYVQILQQKSDRLNHIVADLFELSKSTSGNIALNIEVLDLKRLFEQTLADMADQISASGLEMRLNLPGQPLEIRADGKKLYRVLQNLLDNALKYSLTGSRIYIAICEHKGKAQATIKNTAFYEMDFNAEEVLQRFNRGDKARSSEGSGLGLAIAQSFVHNCGGEFAIEVDGDQFKAIIDFPLA